MNKGRCFDRGLEPAVRRLSRIAVGRTKEIDGDRVGWDIEAFAVNPLFITDSGMPTRGMLPVRPIGCCARAASGHPATMPPSSVINSRRFNWSNCIRFPPVRIAKQNTELSRISQRA